MAGCGCVDANPREPVACTAQAWGVAVTRGMAHQPQARPLVALQPSTALIPLPAVARWVCVWAHLTKMFWKIHLPPPALERETSRQQKPGRPGP